MLAYNLALARLVAKSYSDPVSAQMSHTILEELFTNANLIKNHVSSFSQHFALS